MATAADFRAELARSMDLYHSGVVESATTDYITDTLGLARFTEANQLVGGTVSTMEDKVTSFTDVQWRHITSYDGAGVIGVEYPILAPAAGDPYEVFMAMTPDQWNEAINQAIRSAWPSIYEVRRVNPSVQVETGNTPRYTFSEKFDSVQRVLIEDPVNYPGYGAQPIPPAYWTYDSPMTTNGQGTLTIHRDLRDAIALGNIHVYVNGRYEPFTDFSAGSYPTMDQAYLLAESKANAYDMMVGATHIQSHVVNYQTMGQFWREVADRRKAEIAATLTEAEFSDMAPS